MTKLSDVSQHPHRNKPTATSLLQDAAALLKTDAPFRGKKPRAALAVDIGSGSAPRPSPQVQLKDPVIGPAPHALHPLKDNKELETMEADPPVQFKDPVIEPTPALRHPPALDARSPSIEISGPYPVVCARESSIEMTGPFPALTSRTTRAAGAIHSPVKDKGLLPTSSKLNPLKETKQFEAMEVDPHVEFKDPVVEPTPPVQRHLPALDTRSPSVEISGPPSVVRAAAAHPAELIQSKESSIEMADPFPVPTPKTTPSMDASHSPAKDNQQLPFPLASNHSKHPQRASQELFSAPDGQNTEALAEHSEQPGSSLALVDETFGETRGGASPVVSQMKWTGVSDAPVELMWPLSKMPAHLEAMEIDSESDLSMDTLPRLQASSSKPELLVKGKGKEVVDLEDRNWKAMDLSASHPFSSAGPGMSKTNEALYQLLKDSKERDKEFLKKVRMDVFTRQDLSTNGVDERYYSDSRKPCQLPSCRCARQHTGGPGAEFGNTGSCVGSSRPYPRFDLKTRWLY